MRPATSLFVFALPCLALAGDSIVACGQKFQIDAPVVLWSDPGGFDAYKVGEAAVQQQKKKGFDIRKGLDDKATLEALRETVDQFVLHYDVCGTSKVCFKVL